MRSCYWGGLMVHAMLMNPDRNLVISGLESNNGDAPIRNR